MKDSSNKLVLFLFGGLSCLAFTATGNADGRLFVLTLENSTGLTGFRDAERACASLHARLASSAELRHAVVECFFSTCTRGWLYGGTVGTTVCNVVGSALKAVDVKTENATEDFAHLNAFCIKDRGVPCGDPPSFPNTRLQGHSGYEMGDELLYTCAPGYVMPSRHKAFSLLCDSCGEWYGMVEICVKDETEALVDYEDKFPDADGGLEDRDQRAEEANGEVQEEVHGAAHAGWKPSQQQETTFSLGQAHRDTRVEGDVAANGEREEEQAVGDFIGHPMSEQEPGLSPDAATEAPVSLLSQKHMFWFPSEAFQDEVTQRDSSIQSEESKENESQEMNSYQKPIDPDDSPQESDHYVYHDTDDHHDHHGGHHDGQHERDIRQDYGDHDDQPKPHTPPQHEVQDGLDHPENQEHGDDHYDMGEHDEDHSRTRYGGQEHDDRDDTYDEHESYEDHEDVTEDRRDGEQELVDDSQEHPDQDDSEDLGGDEDQYNQKVDDRDHYTDDDHDDDDHEDLSDDHDHEDLSDDHDHDDLSDDHDHDDLSDDHDHDGLSDDHDRDDLSDDHDRDDLSDDHDHDDHDDLSDDHDHDGDDHRDHGDHDDHHDHDDHDDLGGDHDDHDDYDDQHHHGADHDDLIDRTDENDHDDGNDHNDQDDPLDSDDHSDHKDDDRNSYEDPDSQEEVKDRDYHVIFSITRDHHQNITEVGDGGKAITDETWLDGYPVVATQREKEDPMGGRSKDEDKDTGAFNEVESQKPLAHTSLPEESKPSSKEPPLQQGGGQETWPGFIPTANPTLTAYREPAAPTQQSFINHDPVPPVRDSDALMEEHTMNNRPGESGERGEMEGEIGETVCTGENCPPPASAGQSSKVASIIVVVCLVAIAVMVGVWCYRRQQQKSSVYEMNGKGQSQSGPAQQMEMQQKV